MQKTWTVLSLLQAEVFDDPVSFSLYLIHNDIITGCLESNTTCWVLD